MSFSVSHLTIFGCVAYAHVRKKMRRKSDDKSFQCILVGYNEESKAYRLYNSITKKYIASRDIEFKEEEAWDGSIDKFIIGGVVLSHGDDDRHEKAIQSRQLIPHTNPPIARTPVRQSPGVGPSEFRMPRTQEHGEPSSYGGQQAIGSEVSNDSNLTLATLRNKIRGQKTRSLRELYQKNQEVDQVSNFALIAYDPINFDEVVKKEVWVEAMYEEIDAIEINNTWELVDFPNDKNNIGVKWIYKTMLNVEREVEKSKARLVAQGFCQQPSIYYNKTFAPIARLDIVRMVLAIATQKKWCVSNGC